MKKVLILCLLLTFVCTAMLIAATPTIPASVAGNYYKGYSYNPFKLQYYAYNTVTLSTTTTNTYGTPTSAGQSTQFLAVDPSNGNIWVTNYGAPGDTACFVFDKDGGETSIGAITWGLDYDNSTTYFQQCGGVAYNPKDGLMYVVARNQYVAATSFSHIYRFTTAGVATTGFRSPFSNPSGIAIDTNGNIFQNNKVGHDFVVYDYLSGATISYSVGTGGGNVRGIGVSPDGTTVYTANDVNTTLRVYTGTPAGGYTLSTSVPLPGAGGGSSADVIGNVLAVCETNLFRIDLLDLTNNYSLITSIDLKTGLAPLGALIYGPIKPRGVAISADSTKLFVANFASAGPMVGVIPLDYTKITVNSAGGANFSNVSSALASIVSGGTFATGTSPFVINIAAGSGPYDEAINLAGDTAVFGAILGDLILQTDTPGSKVNIQVRKNPSSTSGIEVIQSKYDVTFKDIIFSPSTTTKITGGLIRVDEATTNKNFNWVNVFDCVLTAADTTGAPMVTSKASALAQLWSIPSTGSTMGNGSYLFSNYGDAGESHNIRIFNSTFYAPKQSGIRSYNDGAEGEQYWFKDCLLVNVGPQNPDSSPCLRIGNTSSSGVRKLGFALIEGSYPPSYGAASCFAILGAAYHAFYLGVAPEYNDINLKNVMVYSYGSTQNRRPISGSATNNINVTNAIFDCPGPIVAGMARPSVWNNMTLAHKGGLGGGMYFLAGPVGQTMSFNSCIISNSILGGGAVPQGGVYFNVCGFPNQGAYSSIPGFTTGTAIFTNIQRSDPMFANDTDPTQPNYFAVTNQYYAPIAGGGGAFIGGATPAGFPLVPVDRILRSINANGLLTFGNSTVQISVVAEQDANLDPARISRYAIDTVTKFGVLMDQSGGVATNPTFAPGDIMVATGNIVNYNGAAEFVVSPTLDGGTVKNLGASGYAFTTTTLASCSALNVFDQLVQTGGNKYFANLIQLSSVTIAAAVSTVTSGGNFNILVTDFSGATTILFIDKDSGADEYLSTVNGGVFVVGDSFSYVRGVGAIYDSTSPYYTGQEIIPSVGADFGTFIPFVTPVRDWSLY